MSQQERHGRRGAADSEVVTQIADFIHHSNIEHADPAPPPSMLDNDVNDVNDDEHSSHFNRVEMSSSLRGAGGQVRSSFKRHALIRVKRLLHLRHGRLLINVRGDQANDEAA